LDGPSAPAGVTHWGLRTLWCFWIDHHLAKIDQIVGDWLNTAKQKILATTGGSSNLGRNFITNHMTGAGWATTSRMHFPRVDNYASIPLPGTAGSAATMSSRYGMWGNNGFGPLGI